MRSSIKKTAIGCATTIAVVASLAGCGSSSANENEITFFANNTQDNYQKLIDGFEAANPGLTIKFSTTNGAQAGYQQTLQTRISGGQLTDVFVAPPEQLNDLVKNNCVKDLTDEPFMDVIGDTNKEQSSVDGRVYSMSVTSWTNAFAYNKDLLAKAGYDNIPETWDDFVRMLKDLKDAGVETPYLEPKAGLGAMVESWIGYDSSTADKSIDQQITDGDTTFEQTYGEYYAEWAKLFDEGVMGSEVTGLGDDQVRTEFASGRLAVMPSGYWDVNTFKEAGLNFAFGRLPMLHEGDTPYAPGSADSGYAINAKLSGAKLENAEKFLEYIASEEGLKLLQEGVGLIPATKNYTPVIDETFAEPYEMYISTGNLYLNTLGWPTTGRSALRAETFAQLQQVALGSETPAEAAANLDAKIKTLS
ncbi:ABC transporter substrate-binding protein [Bifidobacterium eulemuris]|uniref:ABC transporter substrate-binding protein n=1 Tax=Bifidobacterium eulemuris TaxID=1765219 RepID=A0A261FYQ1_9BIFI|nr:extracellular solute-binding protein [Bifidobacterium eulemuris]OZG64063.1 ABC transporter substrate-binding protein [Bifidobacterium eulemuris]QOL32568.1 extracellular solute-binding protein [Bifidobacterium eulemuris]